MRPIQQTIFWLGFTLTNVITWWHCKILHAYVLSTLRVLSCMLHANEVLSAQVSQTVNWALLASTFGVRERKVGFVGGRRQKNLCLWPRTRSGSTLRRSFIDSSGTFTLRLWRGAAKSAMPHPTHSLSARQLHALAEKKYAPCRYSRASERVILRQWTKLEIQQSGQETNLCCMLINYNFLAHVKVSFLLADSNRKWE